MKVAFIGHRKIDITEELKERVEETVTALIDEGADTFLFGSRSQFDDLCYEVVTEIKNRYPNIRRVFVRAEYEYISDVYRSYLLTMYEDTFYPDAVCGSGVLSYVKRNQVMVDMSDVVVVYCDMNYLPSKRSKSGTIIATSYAQRKHKQIINLCTQSER